eukprot:gb/GECG01013015.1/.p2 GENE.gb/GECG01013015.1/~~gb/GECG01013015.1/.p2  ORF type:complete len:257 (+),score=17.23 gb/GECG01013015.1/:221-991(+)
MVTQHVHTARRENTLTRQVPLNVKYAIPGSSKMLSASLHASIVRREHRSVNRDRPDVMSASLGWCNLSLDNLSAVFATPVRYSPVLEQRRALIVPKGNIWTKKGRLHVRYAPEDFTPLWREESHAWRRAQDTLWTLKALLAERNAPQESMPRRLLRLLVPATETASKGSSVVKKVTPLPTRRSVHLADTGFQGKQTPSALGTASQDITAPLVQGKQNSCRAGLPAKSALGAMIFHSIFLLAGTGTSTQPLMDPAKS